MTDRPIDDVVLLHGLGRTPLSLKRAEWRLRRNGFRPLNVGYPSRRMPIEALADHVADKLVNLRNGGRLHFVTHSMGGIVVRAFVARHRPKRLGRTVMLAPPNQGSRLAQQVTDRWWGRVSTIRHALRQLGTGGESVPLGLGPVDFEVGVIAGNRSSVPFGAWLGSDNDGKVRVDEAHVDGMADLLVVPRSHSFIMNDGAVLDQVVHFLRRGRFDIEAGEQIRGGVEG